jgi:hypothetical protein
LISPRETTSCATSAPSWTGTANGARQQQADRAFGAQGDAALLAAIDAGLADDFAFGEELALLESAEAPFEQLASLGGAVTPGLEAVDDDDQALAVLDRRTDQPEAGLIEVAGLQAIGADLHGQ